MSFVNSDIPLVDLRSAIEGAARRWWVILVSVLVAIGVVFAQDSGLRSSANGDVVVTRTYEAVAETNDLNIVKVDPSLIVPVPSFDNQLAILQSNETRLALQELTGSDAAVDVTRSESKFTIVETLDDANNRVSFLATGTPSYTVRCVGKVIKACETLLDAYATKIAELRKESVLGGVSAGLSLVESLIDTAEKRLASGEFAPELRRSQQDQLAQLLTSRDALEAIQETITGRVIFIDQQVSVTGKSTSSATSSTYGFGLGVGLIAGILLALQLAALDKTIRHRWQIYRVNENIPVIGSHSARSDDVQLAAIASALSTARTNGAKSSLIVAQHDSLAEFATKVSGVASGMQSEVVGSIESMNVDQLAGGSTRVVIVLIKAGITTRNQLADTVGLVTSGGNRLIGVALID